MYERDIFVVGEKNVIGTPRWLPPPKLDSQSAIVLAGIEFLAVALNSTSLGEEAVLVD